jgi:hypothetical protein
VSAARLFELCKALKIPLASMFERDPRKRGLRKFTPRLPSKVIQQTSPVSCPWLHVYWAGASSALPLRLSCCARSLSRG